GKRQARGSIIEVSRRQNYDRTRVCAICGTDIKSAYKYCRKCTPIIWRENVRKAAKIGRQNTHKPEAQARRAETQRRQSAALKAWNPPTQPAWLDEKFYRERVQPRLRTLQA